MAFPLSHLMPDPVVVSGAGIAGLPTELLVKVILELDWRSVLRLQLVNTKFDEIVKTHVAVQYHLELGIEGLTDGPPSPTNSMTTNERLGRLHLYQSRWKHFDFKRLESVRKVTGSIWELSSGVLAQGVPTSTSNTNNAVEHVVAGGAGGGRTRVRKLLFRTLPSSARMESEGREWTHEYGDFAVRDFTMDPAQDLLVLLRDSNGGGGGNAAGGAGPGPGINGGEPDTHSQHSSSNMNVAEIRLRSLKTNCKHPNAKSEMLVHGLHGGTRTRSHSLQVCRGRLGVLHKARAGHWPEKLVVYDWRVGKLLFEISFCGIMSFAFLDPHHLLFAVQPFNVIPACQGDHQPRFVICDIDRTAALCRPSPSPGLSHGPVGPGVGHHLHHHHLTSNAYVATCEFHLPELNQYADVVDILIRTDSAAGSWAGNGTDSTYDGEDGGEDGSGGVLPPPAFSNAEENRLFVITMQVETVLDDMGDHRASENVTLGLFVPLTTFMPFMSSSSSSTTVTNLEKDNPSYEIIPANSDDDSLYFGDFHARPARRIAVKWRDWMGMGALSQLGPEPGRGTGAGEGAGGARALLLPGSEEVWVCNVSGMRCVVALEPRDVFVPLAPRHVVVYDFGAGVQRRDRDWEREWEHHSTPSTDPEIPTPTRALSRALTQDYLEPSTLAAGCCGIFEEDVTTGLPYRRSVLREKVRFDGVMITEDNVLFVNQRAPREYEVLTF